MPEPTETELLRAELAEWKQAADTLWEVEQRALHLWNLGDRGRVRYILTGSWSTNAHP